MKKVLLLIAAFVLTFSLAACSTEELDNQIADLEQEVSDLTSEVAGLESDKAALEDEIAGLVDPLPELPAEVTMDNVDDYLGRPDVQYVDVRNFDDKMNAGYIAGFEMIPFFDYLEYEGILVRTDGWNFEAASLQNESALTALFDADKAIFVMCGSGTRAAFVKAALEAAGYDNVYNVGGISDYDGDNLVLGDGSYSFTMPKEGDYTPGIYYGMDEAHGYYATVVINNAGGIEQVILNALYTIDPDGIADSGDEYVTTKQALGGDYGMLAITGKAWFEHANELAAALVANQGWNADWDIYDAGSHDKFVVDDEEVILDGIAGVTIGIEGFKVAFEEAIAQAE
jgi:rhodanese-related sulfurtransferase/outer membrane murein-binding lipoprotein Lpp